MSAQQSLWAKDSFADLASVINMIFCYHLLQNRMLSVNLSALSGFKNAKVVIWSWANFKQIQSEYLKQHKLSVLYYYAIPHTHDKTIYNLGLLTRMGSDRLLLKDEYRKHTNTIYISYSV